MTYTELCTLAQSYVENTFTTTQLAQFVGQAERRIYNAVQIPALRKNVSGALTSANQFLACPTDFLATYSMAVVDPLTGAYTYLINKDASFLREAYTVPSATGTPKYYAIFGPRSDDAKELTFFVAPTPDAAYVAELQYFFYPETLATAGSTWLSDNYDPVLLYGMVLEMYTFMKGEPDLLKLYIAKYEEALMQLRMLCQGQETSDSYRSGTPRIPVK
jgi:hypothetical protein